MGKLSLTPTGGMEAAPMSNPLDPSPDRRALDEAMFGASDAFTPAAPQEVVLGTLEPATPAPTHTVRDEDGEQYLTGVAPGVYELHDSPPAERDSPQPVNYTYLEPQPPQWEPQ